MSSGHLAKSVVILVYIPYAGPITNLANTVSDEQHCVMWDNRGADVSRAYMYIDNYVCIPAFVYVYINTFILYI